MAALPAGVPYGLSSESSFKENKELVFVKLTDSALKAIEDFIRNNRDKLAKPTIQFLPGNEGKISIPAAASSNALSSGEATFHFSLNSNAEMEGPQGSFECVRNAGPKQLESCGPMPRRMRIHANDDSYVATKDRMARTVAAEQSKCTRVIKPNQTDIGRRVKVRASHAPHAAHGAHGANGAHGAHGGAHGAHGAHGHFSGASQPERVERPDRMERPERPERNERPERPDRPMPLLPGRPHPPAAPHQPHAPHPTHAPHPPHASHAPHPTHAPPPQQPPPQPPQQPQLPQQQHRPPTNPDVARRSIKERLIQLLALKPFKKPELYARLQSEGIKDKERSLVNKILPSIGTLKDNCYHLRRHIWNDVNEDWPFYSEEEKRILKRRKPQNLTPPLSSDSANSLSPRASPSASKRTSTNANADELPAKKQRISHYRRPSPPSSGYATTSSGERHASDNEDERTNVKKDNGYTLNYTTVKQLCPSPVKTNGFRNSPPVEQTNITEKDNDITNSEPLEQSVDVSAVTETDPRVLEEVEREYPPITSSSDRSAYKMEFVKHYQEYRRLYHRVARVANLFTRLEAKLRGAEPLSPHHQSIGQRIVEEYNRLRHDDTYQKETARFNFLHTKLTHIKRMVQEFDDMCHLKADRVSTASTTQAY